MFDHDYGFGPGKWLRWLFGLLAVYAVLTMFPENATVMKIAGLLAIAAVAVARWKISSFRRDR